LCTVRTESISAVYLGEATNFGVTYLDRLESWLWPQLIQDIQQDFIQFLQHGAQPCCPWEERKFCLMTNYQNFRLFERDKHLDLRYHPKLANQAFPWGVSEGAYVIVNLYYIII
jgi:hypothetical protein